MKLITLAALLSSSTIYAQEKHLEIIDFFGYEGMDIEAVRKALPFREGDIFPTGDEARNAWKQSARETVIRVTGKEATDVNMVCCTSRGNAIVFIGLRRKSSSEARYNPKPTGTGKLPPDLTKLDAEIDAAWYDAVQKGSIGEDRSAGYSLLTDPNVRTKQLAFRDLAIKCEQQIIHTAATSSDDDQRAIAATALGYIRQTDAQLDALIQSSSDPNSIVRNNAVRALGLLVGVKPQYQSKIPRRVFIDLVRSGVWTDRNKGSILLFELTSKRDPNFLSEVRRDAMQPLIEIAKWRSTGHAYAAQVLLGRIAGIEEKQLQKLIRDGQIDAIIQAAQEKQ